MIWLLAFQLAAGAAQHALGPAQYAVGPAQHYENAKQDFAGRKYADADNELNAALKESPYMVPALVLKARLATFAQRPDVAKSCLITAITADPGSEEAQFFLGLHYYTQNDFRLALSPLETARSLSPKAPLPVFYLAMTNEALGESAKALELYQQAENLSAEKSAERAEILVAYARLLLSLGRTEEGVEGARRAVAADSQSREAHYELAKGLNHQGDYKNAAAEAEQALTLPQSSTSDAQIHYLLVNLYRKLDQPDLAKAHLEKFQATPETKPR